MTPIGRVMRSHNVADRAYVQLEDAYVDGAIGLERFSHLIIVYLLPEAPFQLAGVFTTRAQPRPTPIGVCVVELLRIEDELLTVQGLDAPEGATVVDIKPYNPRTDAVPGAVKG